MIDSFVKEYFNSIKEYNNDPNKGIKKNTHYSLSRALFYPYAIFFSVLLILYSFQIYKCLQYSLLVIVLFLLLLLIIVDYFNRTKIEKFRSNRKNYFINKYLNTLILYKIQSESELLFEKDFINLDINHTKNEKNLAPSVKELALIIKELANKS
ncbi:hypothetical protein OKS35_14585, partial [Exiguobacterium sp. N5]|uniref:hypothetical protein n=1 Tax=Exiguobacterium sp. N5 TaxID=2990450 RepID=UPI0021F4C773